MSIRPDKVGDKMQLADLDHPAGLSPYPIDMSMLLTQSQTLDEGVSYRVDPAEYHPIGTAQYALVHWNQFLATNDEYSLEEFLTQAYWLVEHESRISGEAGGWPISVSRPDFHTRGPCLSALMQGIGVSVLIRAYQLTRKKQFLDAAHRVVRTFERDILDGGISTPVGGDGIFFEEVAVYPATHRLSGFIFALFGLYDYVELTGDSQIERLIHKSLTTMHTLLDEFDVGFWNCSDLLHRRLASPSHLALQAALLEVLSRYSGCEHCARLASHWRGYQRRLGSRLRYLIATSWSSCVHALLVRARTALFPRPEVSPLLRVCVPLPDFPFTGGILTVLEGVARVTRDSWQLEYLAQLVGPNPEGFVIHRFGTARMTQSAFPNVCLYVLAGFCKLVSLIRQRSGYNLVLPQDATFTGAFAALAARLAGVRVVCIDHGTLTLLKSSVYRTECIQALATRPWPLRLFYRVRLAFYLPFIYLLAWVFARLIDHFLVPGVAGDGVEEVCRRLGIPQSKITRFASMIDIDRHVILDAPSKASLREKNGIVADAIVVAIICRLAPEKGLKAALEGMSKALSTVSPDLRARVRVIIAGDGPLRKQVEGDIRKCGLEQTCLLWGDISACEVLSLLAMSDIFLYTSTRGACFSMAVLEAMASGCAVIASTQPVSNASLLAEGRGIAVPADDIEQMSSALVRLLNDLELCRQMGSLARDYIAAQHSAALFKRTLLRTTYWSALGGFLTLGKEREG